MSNPSIPAGACIGHVHLKVAEIERSVRFYHDLMGFDIVAQMGNQAAFLSAGGYHHHLGLNTWESAGGKPPAKGTTGLFHYCVLYPTRKDLAAALKRLLDGGWGIDGASDHGTHEAIYLHDPDFNGIELAWDRDPSQWPRRDGAVNFAGRKPLDFKSLLDELSESYEPTYLPMLAAYQ